MFLPIISFGIILLISYLFYVYYRYKYNYYQYWSERNLPGPAPIFPFGNVLLKFLKPAKELEFEYTSKYGKLYGIYYGSRPTLTVNDPELIKQVLIKDFHLITDRRESALYHEVWNVNLFLSKSDKWKRLRSIMSPVFTSKKLRSMYRLMDICIDNLVHYLDDKTKSNEKSIDAREICVGLTIDVIASTVFATDTNSHKHTKDDPLIKHGVNFFKLPLHKLLCFWILPRWMNDLINVRHVYSSDHFNFFLALATRIVKNRKESPLNARQDLLQILNEANASVDDYKSNKYEHLTATMEQSQETKQSSDDQKSGKRTYLTEVEIIAQCLVFFVAGFETTSMALAFVLYELSMNEDCQERLFKVLDEFQQKNSDQPFEEYCENIMTQIPYLDAVVKETLRKYPPLLRIDRTLGVDNYQINGMTLKKGTFIEVSTLAVHYCPDYYPDPERFNPERFMPENKHLINPYAYLPFSIGPRNCIGMRFAYQELKLAISRLILRYRFSKNEKTPAKFTFPKGTLLNVLKTLPLNVERR